MDHHKKKQQQLLLASIGDDILGFLNDPSIKEIMLNPDGTLFIENITEGLIKTDFSITNIAAERLIRVIAGLTDQTIDHKAPVISAALPYFSARFQGWISPACPAPSFCIRKHTAQSMSLQDWVKTKGIPTKIANLLHLTLKEKKNILICGGTGSGKTTLANSLLHCFENSNERIITIEDTAELHIPGNNHVSLLAKGNLTMHDCLKGALRMRPDRIIIGEVRDGSVLDLLKSWNTGHGGGIATIHANNIQGALQRLEDLTLEVISSPPKRLIAEVVDLIVVMKKNNNHRICVDQVAEVIGLTHDFYDIKKIPVDSH